MPPCCKNLKPGFLFPCKLDSSKEAEQQHFIGVSEAVKEASRSCVTGAQSAPALSVLMGMGAEVFVVWICMDVYLSLGGGRVSSAETKKKKKNGEKEEKKKEKKQEKGEKRERNTENRMAGIFKPCALL